MEGNEHSLRAEEVLKNFETTEKGLDSRRASSLLKKYGYNELAEKKRYSVPKLLLGQFTSLMVLILIIAAVVSFFLGELLDSVFILVIVVINAVLGFAQEYRAEKALESLKNLTTPKAVAYRDGEKKDVSAKELVPGDIIFVDEGMSIPADSRIIRCASLNVDESLITGESQAVSKNSEPVKLSTSLPDRTDMLYMGSIAMSGSGIAVVTSTGMQTRIGRITKIVQEAEQKSTPLQKDLNALTKTLAGLMLLITVMIFAIGILNHQDLFEMFFVTVGLAVAAIPEGLPAIVTATLAMGVQRMARKNAIVRKLNAAETLGSTNIICSDKTGTLTKNEMTVREYYFASGPVAVTGIGYEPKGNFIFKNKAILPDKNRELKKALEIGVLCNDAGLEEDSGKWKIVGDHTEGALVVAARKAGISKNFFDNYKLLSEIPFTSNRKMMSKAYSCNRKSEIFLKGAPEIMIPKCTRILVNGKVKKLDSKTRGQIYESTSKMTSKSLRVLLLAFRDFKGSKISEKDEKDLVFVGIVGMQDPPRREVKDSIAKARSAGIRTIMITGDHAATAKSVASEIGLVKGDVGVITGSEIDDMNDAELCREMENISVFARVSPEHKVRLLKALQSKKGNVVAMTGDGVNDAPALKNADIGVAMGMKGTDVAKNSSEIILLDDNYSTIIHAVEEGRTIYDNIRKFVRYLLAANFAELFVVGIAALIGLPLPLIALQLLWLNLVTDGLPALALGIDPSEPDVMKRPPRKRSDKLLSGMLVYSLVSGVISFAITFCAFLYGLGTSVDYARTMALMTIVAFELYLVFSARSSQPIIKSKPFSNKYLIASLIFSFAVQIIAVYTSFFDSLLGTVPLKIADLAAIFIVTGLGVLVIDTTKLLKRNGNIFISR